MLVTLQIERVDQSCNYFDSPNGNKIIELKPNYIIYLFAGVFNPYLCC